MRQNCIIFFYAAPHYAAVLDIGCAEGYYAAGCARLWPVSEVYAYDIDPTALRLCAALADANGVAKRVHVRGACTPETLISFDFPQGRSLIISDCEGYEAALFTPSTLPYLAGCDLLIEVHLQAGLDFYRAHKRRCLCHAQHAGDYDEASESV